MSLPVAILAGGLATRLRPLTEEIPKALVDVDGQPFVVRQLELLRQHRLTRVVLCVGHLGEMVQETLDDGHRWGMEVSYSFDGPVLLGTGGALRQALPLLGEAFFVLYGDSYLQCNYTAVEQAFLVSGKPGLMTVFRNAGQWDRSNIIFRNGRIECYNKRHPIPEMEYIDYGVGVLWARAFDAYPLDFPLDLATVYQALLARDQLAAFEVNQRFYEIGSLAGLEETRRYFVQQREKNELRSTTSG